MIEYQEIVMGIVNELIKDKPVLKMFPDDVNWAKIKATTKYEDVPEEERDNNGWWYLHYKLEDIVGYDKATTSNCKSAGYSRKTIRWSEISGNKVNKVRGNDPENYYNIYINSIVPVEVEGVDKPCVGFFWTTDEHDIYWKDIAYPHWYQRGLVCLMEDINGIEDAYNKFLEKTTVL